MAGGCLLLLGPAVQPAKFWASTSRKSRPPAPRLPLGERWVISLRLAGRSGNPNKLLLICPLFHVGRDADKISVSASQRTVSVCLSVCLCVCESVPRSVSVRLSPSEARIPTFTNPAWQGSSSGDVSRHNTGHARARVCLRATRARATYLLYSEVVGGENWVCQRLYSSFFA